MSLDDTTWIYIMPVCIVMSVRFIFLSLLYNIHLRCHANTHSCVVFHSVRFIGATLWASPKVLYVSNTYIFYVVSPINYFMRSFFFYHYLNEKLFCIEWKYVEDQIIWVFISMWNNFIVHFIFFSTFILPLFPILFHYFGRIKYW